MNQYINPVKNTIPSARPEPVLHSPYPTEPENGPLAGAVPTIVPPGTFTPPPVMNSVPQGTFTPPQPESEVVTNPGQSVFPQDGTPQQQNEEELRSKEFADAVKQDMAATERIKNDPNYLLMPSGVYANKYQKQDVFDPKANFNRVSATYKTMDDYGFNREEMSQAEQIKSLLEKRKAVNNPEEYAKITGELKNVFGSFGKKPVLFDYLSGKQKNIPFKERISDVAGNVFDTVMRNGATTPEEKDQQAFDFAMNGNEDRPLNNILFDSKYQLKNEDGSYKTPEQLQAMGEKGIIDTLGVSSPHEYVPLLNIGVEYMNARFLENSARRLGMPLEKFAHGFRDKLLAGHRVQYGNRPPSSEEMRVINEQSKHLARELRQRDAGRLLDAWNKNQDEFLRGKNTLGTAADIVAKMIPFAASIAMTSGSSAALQTAAKTAAKRGISAEMKITSNAMAKKILGDKLTGYVGRGVGKTVQEGSMLGTNIAKSALAGGAFDVAGGVADAQRDYMTNAVSLDNNGEIQFDRDAKPDYYKGIAGQWVERNSEYMGGLMMGPITSVLKKALPKKLLSLSEKFEKLGENNKVFSTLNKYRKKAGFGKDSWRRTKVRLWKCPSNEYGKSVSQSKGNKDRHGLHSHNPVLRIPDIFSLNEHEHIGL